MFACRLQSLPLCALPCPDWRCCFTTLSSEKRVVSTGEVTTFSCCSCPPVHYLNPVSCFTSCLKNFCVQVFSLALESWSGRMAHWCDTSVTEQGRCWGFSARSFRPVADPGLSFQDQMCWTLGAAGGVRLMMSVNNRRAGLRGCKLCSSE